MDQQINIGISVIPVLFGERVRAHESGHEPNRLGFVQILHSTKLFQLCLEVEPIAAFCFTGCCAVAQHAGQYLEGFVLQFFPGCSPCSAYGGKYSAALCQDIEIWHSLKLQRQLMLAPAAEYQMRMRVHKPGCNQASPGIDQMFSAFIGLSLADFIDQSVTDENIRVIEIE